MYKNESFVEECFVGVLVFNFIEDVVHNEKRPLALRLICLDVQLNLLHYLPLLNVLLYKFIPLQFLHRAFYSVFVLIFDATFH